MNTLQIAAMTATIVNVLVTSFVLWSDIRAKSTGAYVIWGISLTIWNVGTYFAVGDIPLESARTWLQVLQLGVIFLPVSLLHLCLILASVEMRKLTLWLYVLHVVFAASLPTDLFVRDVQRFPFGYWAVPGPLFWAYLVCYSAENVGMMFALTAAQRRASPHRRTQLRLMQFALIFLLLCGTNDLLPLLGATHYPGTAQPFIPLANLAAILYALIVAYNLLQHSFLAVHVSMSRSVAQLVRLLFVSAIGLVLLLITATLAPPGKVTEFSFVTSLIVVLASAAIASVVFPRLFGQGEDALERRIMGDRFEYRDRVRSFVESMIWYDDLDALLDDLHTLLVRTLGIASYKIVLRDDVLHVFTLHRAHPPEDGATLPEIKVNSPIFQYFEWSKSEYLALNAKYARSGESNMGRLARRQFAPTGSEFAFPLTSQSEPFGLLLAGPHVHGAEYSGSDIAMLVGLVKNLSIMVNQVRLKTQIRQNQDFELLGKMSRGMAHDLNNLLTPITTLLQLSTESGPGATLDEELLPVAMRNVKTMRAYIRESLFFSENLRLQLQTTSLDEVIAEAAATARSSRDKPIQIAVESPGGVEIDMDAVLLQRLIVNLISNAIDASTRGTTIQVRLERLPKVEVARDWVRLRVVDQGEGISKENLNRVLTPYFTTKNRGDSNRGFGLGLAICRKIVNLHGGNLSIASQVKKGTTVQVDLPTRQTTPTMPLVPVPA
jgi:signal transduction histidine kinase